MKTAEQVLEKHPDHPGMADSKRYANIFRVIGILIDYRVTCNEGIDPECSQEEEGGI